MARACCSSVETVTQQAQYCNCMRKLDVETVTQQAQYCNCMRKLDVAEYACQNDVTHRGIKSTIGFEPMTC